MRIRRQLGELPKKLTAYLAFYADRWEAILKPEDHRHEIGETTEECVNCRLNVAANKLSGFEVGIWNWYFEVVNHFTLEAGIVAGEFREIGLKGSVRRMALSALNAIHQTFQTVAVERAKKTQEQ